MKIYLHMDGRIEIVKPALGGVYNIEQSGMAYLDPQLAREIGLGNNWFSSIDELRDCLRKFERRIKLLDNGQVMIRETRINGRWWQVPSQGGSKTELDTAISLRLGLVPGILYPSLRQMVDVLNRLVIVDLVEVVPARGGGHE